MKLPYYGQLDDAASIVGMQLASEMDNEYLKIISNIQEHDMTLYDAELEDTKLQVAKILQELDMPADASMIERIALRILRERSSNQAYVPEKSKASFQERVDLIMKSKLDPTSKALAISALMDLRDDSLNKARVDLTTGQSLRPQPHSNVGSDGLEHAAYIPQRGGSSAANVVIRTTPKIKAKSAGMDKKIDAIMKSNLSNRDKAAAVELLTKSDLPKGALNSKQIAFATVKSPRRK